MKKYLLIFVFMLVASLHLPASAAKANSMAEAVPISLNSSISGKLTDWDDEDFYKFTIPSDGNVTVTFGQKTNAQWEVSILNTAGEVYESLVTDDSEMVLGNATTQVGLPKGTYYIEVDSYSSAYDGDDNYNLKVTHQASPYFEKEFNNNLTTANLIALNSTYKGKLKNWDDDDFFKVVLPSNGNLTLSVKQKTDAEWYAHIQSSTGQVYDYLYTDDSEMVSGYSTIQVGLPKGTYYIKIDNSSSAYYDPYEFKTIFTSSNYFEKEFNDSITYANSIFLNKSYKGNLSTYDDQDFYKVSLPSDGNLKLSMKQLAGSEWYAHIQNSKGEVFTSLYTDSRELVQGYATAEVGLPKGTYYIKISNSSSAYHSPYDFKLGFANSSYYEKEFNNSLTYSNSIKTNKVYNGVINSYDDYDFYKFTTPKDGYVDFSMSQIAGGTWYAHIQNSSGNIYNYTYTDSSELVKGNKTFSTWLKKGTYYIKIYNYSYTVNRPYKFSVGMKSNPLKASQLKATNNKGKSDTITVKGLSKGDVVKVYNASSRGSLLTSKKSTGTSAILYLKQLGLKSGKVYVSVTKANLGESTRTPVSFKGEASNNLSKSQVIIKNNKNKKDTVTVSKVRKGDVIRVYSASSKGKLLSSSKVTRGTSTVLYFKQLGKKSGTVYITITKPGMLESKRTGFKFSQER